MKSFALKSKTIKPVIICGPTASGKSALALQLAQKTGGVIINADSQQVYKEIPILSAQPSAGEKQMAPHYLFGEITGDENFNVAIWLDKVTGILKTNTDKLPIIVGGTGMYINALLNGLSPIPPIEPDIRQSVRNMGNAELIQYLGNRADGNTNRMRRNLEVKLTTGRYIDEFHDLRHGHECSPENFVIFNMNVSRETIYDNINKRFVEMVDNGAVEEVVDLLSRGYDPNLPVMKAVGVMEIRQYLQNTFTIQQAIDKAQQRSRNYAKRQMTWFRHQLPEHKIDVASFERAINLLQ